MTIDWKPLVAQIRSHRRFVLTSHMRADCDALGSELALAAALEALGKEVRILNGDPVPPHIAFIDPRHRVESWSDELSRTFQQPEVWLVLDTSAWQQLGPLADQLKITTAHKIVIDHHVSSDDLGAEIYKDTSAEATGRLVLELIEALGVPLTTEMAEALFAALATDTGWFRFNSVSDKTMLAGAALISAGARPEKLFGLLYERHSLARLQLQGRILQKILLSHQGKYASSTVTLQDIAETGAENTDTEDVVNRLLSIAGVEVAGLFVELEPTKIKISLRSKGAIDVRLVAEQFQGGGHKAAAGIRIADTLSKAEQLISQALVPSLS